MSILDAHRNHRAVIVAGDTLRCHDCMQTLLLPTLVPTDHPRGDLHPNTQARNRCELHGDTPPCRSCAADAKAAEGRERVIPEGKTTFPSYVRTQVSAALRKQGETS